MATGRVLDGASDDGNPHMRIYEGEGVSEMTLDRGTSSNSTVSSLVTRLRMACAFIVGQISWPEVIVAILISLLMYIDLAITRNGLSNVTVIGLIPWIGIGLSPLGLGSYSRFLYYPIITTLVFTETITAFVRVTFGRLLSGEWVGIVLCSSWTEFKWFIGKYFGVFCFAVVVVCGLLVFSLWTVSCLKKARLTKIKMIFSLVALLLFARLVAPWRGLEGGALGASSTIFLIVDTIAECQHFHSLANMRMNPIIPEEVNKVGRATGVFVLGESATRNRWSLYGYDKDTTPQMNAISNELVVFRDVVTTASNTAKAMEHLLTTATLEKPLDLRYTLPQVLSKVGMMTSLYTVQGRWGRWDSMEAYAFSGCTPIVSLQELDLDGPLYDEALLPYLFKVLPANQTDSVVFLHLMGSHSPSEERYPSSEARFKSLVSKSEVDVTPVSSFYDNSIAYTDKILGEIVRFLKCRGGASWMIYISDHGETPRAQSWRTATDMDLWEIPMIVWFSDEYKKTNPEICADVTKAADKPLQLDQLLIGFAHIAGVRGCGVGTESDFLDSKFKLRDPRKIENGRLDYHVKSSSP